MAWFVPDVRRTRVAAAVEIASAPPAPATPASFDAWLENLRDLWVAVPCSGCSGAHEMTCAELVARQLLRGASWPVEECDDGVMLHSILSPDDLVGCSGDPAAVRDLLAGRGMLLEEGNRAARTADPHRILLSV